MQIVIIALALVLIAGVINGSFATPMKYMVRWEEENTWFAFSFWGFLILPWLSILLMGHDVMSVVKALPPDILTAMVAGGIAFGLGQIAFALSFRYIGIGLAFVINISMGTAGSALIPILWHKGVMGTPYSYAQLIGIAIFVLAVCLGTAAGVARDRNKAGAQEAEGRTKKIEPGKLVLGVVLAIIAGAGSVAQGVSYIWANPTVQKIATEQFGLGQLTSGVIAWVIIFSAAWIPYVLYFIFLNIKKRSFSKLALPGTGKYWLLAVLMGVGFWGSLIFFSKASQE
ncbi:MAG: L-rhamnose/proton symporter RhaT, partial [bacterium]